MSRLLSSANKTDIQRRFDDAGRPRHISQLASGKLLFLRIIQEVFGMKFCSRLSHVQTSHLSRTPTTNDRWIVFVIPRQPSDQMKGLWDSFDERCDDLWEAP